MKKKILIYSSSRADIDRYVPIIKKILLNTEAYDKLISASEELRDNLNAGLKQIDSSFDRFTGTTDSEVLADDLKNIFFNSNPTLGFQFKILQSGDSIIFNIQSINKATKTNQDDNYKDFINFSRNTYSESDFDRVFKIFKNNSIIEVDDRTLYDD